MECEKIGQINRFGKKKELTCIEYEKSEHRKENNPKFASQDYCNICLNQLYENLWIDKKNKIDLILKGKTIGNFATIGKRANAWICANCKRTPYNNPMESKQEMGFESEIEDIPLILFGSTNKNLDKIDYEITFCFQCVNQLKIIELMTEQNIITESEIKRFNDLLEKTIEAFPDGARYCCMRKMSIPIQQLRQFDCRKCSMFILNENEDSICDPL